MTHIAARRCLWTIPHAHVGVQRKSYVPQAYMHMRVATRNDTGPKHSG